MNPPLTISATCLDAVLSAAVAEHCAGWKRRTVVKPSSFFGQTKKMYADVWSDAEGCYACDPRFSVSVDALIPLLRKYSWTCGISPYDSVYYARIFSPDSIFQHDDGSLPRALCFVLLKSVGFQITP